MNNKNLENNQVMIAGEIVSPFSFSHEAYGEGFYKTEVKVERLSGSVDMIPVVVSERLFDVKNDSTGVMVVITGMFRSYNEKVGEKTRLVLNVFACGIEEVDSIPKGSVTNSILLNGFVCKQPAYRETPRGREITDLLLAVNRSYGKSDYIPCILWGRNARFASTFEVGDQVVLSGRIQSREYVKKISEDQTEVRVAYEVSVSAIGGCVDDEKDDQN